MYLAWYLHATIILLMLSDQESPKSTEYWAQHSLSFWPATAQ